MKLNKTELKLNEMNIMKLNKTELKLNEYYEIEQNWA